MNTHRSILQSTPLGKRFPRIFTIAASAASLCVFTPSARAQTLYQTNFDALTTGQTQSAPGAAGQDGWYSLQSAGAGNGEIENTVADPGQALHEVASAANPSGFLTMDQRQIGPWNIANSTSLTMSFNFEAQSSDLSKSNIYQAELAALGTNYDVARIQVAGGNGSPKSSTGVYIVLYAYNGTNNDDFIPLTVGQNLSWNSFHSVSLIIDQATDRYVSLTVDGQTQNLSAYRLVDNVGLPTPFRGNDATAVNTYIMTNNLGGTATNDSIYWDNVSLTAVGASSVSASAPEPAALLLLVPLIGFAFGRQRLYHMRSKREIG